MAGDAWARCGREACKRISERPRKHLAVIIYTEDKILRKEIKDP